MKSRIDFTGSCGFTMTTRPLVAISPTGAKSFTGSNGMVLPRSAGVVPNDVAVTRSVSPSAGAFATKSAPMLPVAPGLLSTTIGTLRRSDSFGPSTRERMSAPVPGVNGTTTWIGRLGQASWAWTAAAIEARNSRISRRCIRLLWKHAVDRERAEGASFRSQSRRARRPRDLCPRARKGFRALLALRGPRVGGARARRFSHPHHLRPADPLLPRQPERAARFPQHLPPPRRGGLSRGRRQRQALHLLLSRLDLRSRRQALRHPRAGRVSAELRPRAVRPAGAAARGFLSRLGFPELRPRGRSPCGLFGKGARVHRPRPRPVALRPHGGDPRHAGLRHQGELEAARREQLRRLPPHHHARHLARLPEELRRAGEEARERPRAALAWPRQGPRQRPRHHRQRQLPRPARGGVDSDLWRRGEAGARSHSR